MERDYDEMELDLSLSIGGRAQKSEKSKNSMMLLSTNGVKPGNGEASDSENQSRSSVEESAAVDLEKKRKIQAMRRREAKKRRESKQGKRGRSVNGCTEEREWKKTNGYPVFQMQYPYQPWQYVQFSNGVVLPCVMPFWAPDQGGVGNERVLLQPVACRSFGLANGCEDLERNRGKEGGSLSGVSDCWSSQGSRSSESKSRWSQPLPEQPQINDSMKNNSTDQCEDSEHSASSNQTKSTQGAVQTIINKKSASSNVKSDLPGHHDETVSENQLDPCENTEKESKGATMCKPPKHSPMPYVSATGNGPDGKTITGFLYRYTKTEANILCVCHGESFSPAKFVEHAGCKDVSNPLKHITVIPFAFE